MNPTPSRRIELQQPPRPDTDWTVRLALAGAAGFALLITALAVVLANAWPQMSGVRQSVGVLTAKADRIASGQEALAGDIATLRGDLRDDRAVRQGDRRDIATVQNRVGELSSILADLREQTRKLEAEPQPAPNGPAAARERPPQADAALADLRSRIDTLQRRIDQVAAPQPRPPEQPAASPVVAPPNGRTAQVRPAPARPVYRVDEVEREVREMQEVIRRQRPSQASIQAHPPIRIAAPAPKASATCTIADPLAPLTSKTQPRIAPAPKGMSPTALVSWAPSSPTARQDAPAGTPEPRYTRVGINSGVQRFGPLAFPFDAIGNLLAAIGEGIDHLFTGRVYLDRPLDDSAQARR
ncbi:MAG TPA: hypothetical protein VEB22_14370 [Phycisphaerales bacterium]|nr:hypothetical protein [Phycisphaerales bacterium]